MVFEGETFWLTQRRMADLFGVGVQTINHHLLEIYKSCELNEMATIREFRIVQIEGTREVARDLDFYNLDAIIAVGYRVNSRQATQFRIWATLARIGLIGSSSRREGGRYRLKGGVARNPKSLATAARFTSSVQRSTGMPTMRREAIKWASTKPMPRV